MMVDKDIQIIHNCIPDHPHDKVNRVVILAEKHIYAEKPPSFDAARVKNLRQLVMERDVTHGVNHQYRLSGIVQEMWVRVMEREGGRPLYVSDCYLQDSTACCTDYTNHQMPETSPARALADIGVHWTGTAACIMGQPIQAVCTRMHTHYPLHFNTVTRGKVEIDSDDTTFVMARFEDGTPGTTVFSKYAVGCRNDLVATVSGERREYIWRQQNGNRLYTENRERGNGELFTGSNLVHEAVLPYVVMPAGYAMGQPDALMHAIRSFYQSIRTEQYLTGQVLIPLSMTTGGAMSSLKPA